MARAPKVKKSELDEAPQGAQKLSGHWRQLFLSKLAETSNVKLAARHAKLSSTGQVYEERRKNPDFARRWYAALAEGYDNLEMELLAHLRGSEDPDEVKPRARFDTGAALRSLAAHRENVAREKGRRSLADEVATIASINAKIDALRARARANDKAIRTSRAKPGGKARGNG